MASLRQLFLQHVAPTSDAPLMLEVSRAEGMYLYGPDGQQWMDLIAGISVSNLGHCHPSVVAAVQQQAATFMHTLVYGELVMSPQVKLAEYLCSLLPEKLNSVYFTNSGAEATEAAMKLAKRITGRAELVACHQSYHGSTQGALSMIGDEYWRNAFRPLLPGIKRMRYNNKEDLALITNKTAAVFIEPVQAESGITVPDSDYLQAVKMRCEDTGTLLVLDEIQTGCGRTGSLFAFQQAGIEPDVLLLAKGLGGGMPIGAVVASKQHLAAFAKDPVLGHITTFGGNAVCCAAALANLKTIVESRIIDTVRKKEAVFLECLQHRSIQKISSQGLMMAVHLEDFTRLKKVIDYCIGKGLLTDWFLFAPNCLRIAPPLIISEAEIRWACEVIVEALDATEN